MYPARADSVIVASNSCNSMAQMEQGNADDEREGMNVVLATSTSPELAEKSEEEVGHEEKWYTALYEEDSKLLMELLERNPNLQLWKRGWQRKPSRLVIGRPGNYWQEEMEVFWMGRTALHVAARRGCVALLKQVLLLCDNERSTAGSPWSLDDLLLAKDGEYDLDAIAMAVVNGNRDIVTLLLAASAKCDAVADKYCIAMRKSGKSQCKGEDTELVDELKRITREVINRYRKHSQVKASAVKEAVGDTYESWFEALVLHRYDLHKDFNFLPRDEYLFHFLFTGFEAAEAMRLKEIGNLERDEARLNVVCLACWINVLVVTEIAEEASRSTVPGLLEFLWARQDGQGRPPLHIAVQTEPYGRYLRYKALTLTRPQLSINEQILKRIIHARDGAGRTALHRTVALGDPHKTLNVLLLLEKADDEGFDLGDEELKDHLGVLARKYPRNEFHGGRKRVAAEAFRDCLEEKELDADGREFVVDSRLSWRSSGGVHYRIDLRHLSECNGFSGWLWFSCMPIHSAVLHNHFLACLQIVDVSQRRSYVFQEFRAMIPDSDRMQKGCVPMVMLFDCKYMALTRGDTKVAKVMLDYYKNAPTSTDQFWPEAQSSPLLMAAAWGRHDLLQLLIDQKHDPLIEASDGNTALHYAISNKKETIGSEELQCGIDLLAFVNCQQILHRKYKKQREAAHQSILESGVGEVAFHEEACIQRQGCINLLIQEGCNVFKHNLEGQVPYPSKDAHPKFLSWWHDRHVEEFARAQTAQSVAANTISVTAALVATASYVGPLQPPLGYGDDDQLQLEIMAIKVFLICDTLSFYLAIAAIISALVPCLPMPQRSMTEELRRTRWVVIISVSLLFPSIILLSVAFGAASIAIVQTNQTKWDRGGISICTALIGGFICVIVTGIYTTKWLTVVGQRRKLIKN